MIIDHQFFTSLMFRRIPKQKVRHEEKTCEFDKAIILCSFTHISQTYKNAFGRVHVQSRSLVG